MSALNPKGEWMPLTLAQLDFWEEFVLNPGRPLSTVAHCLDFQGPIQHEALIQAIETTTREADILSVRFHLPDGASAPLQQCDRARAPLLKQIDLRDHDAPLQAAKAMMQADIETYLELLDGPVVEQWLIRVGEDRTLWYIRGHHIVLDGYAMMLLEQRCARLYAHFLGRGDAGPPFHPFSSFLVEEARYCVSPRWEADRQYWDTILKRGSLPSVHKDQEGYGGGELHHETALPETISHRLRQVAQEIGIGWPDLLVMLSGAYLASWLSPEHPNGEKKALPLWLPFMSRWGSVGAYLPSMVVNILPLWCDVQSAEPLSGFLRRHATALREQRTHGRYRIEQIATDQQLSKGSRYFFSPLVNVLPFDQPRFLGCQVSRTVVASGYGDGFNITYRSASDAANLVMDLDADASLTTPEDFARHKDRLPAFLAQALAPGALDRSPDMFCRENTPLYASA